jgi:acetyl esterase/lipase
VDQLAPVARHLAKQGIVAILADYRTYCRDGVDVADEVGDASAAMVWVRAHAHEIGGDTKRIAALGGSSGGHLALSTALFGNKTSRPDLLLLFYPCVDLTNPYELDYSAKAIGAHGRDLSPLYHLRKDMPPAYVFQGTDDPLIDENRRFCTEAQSLGATCEWHEFQGAKHGFFNPAGPTAATWMEPGFKALDEALGKAGYLRPPR